jgi:hypothetical protein
MRVLKTIYLSALFVLAMGLFCGELPESLRLLDDTTNDYVTDSSASAVREDKSEAAQIKTVCEEHAAPARCGVDSFSAAFFETKPSPLTGQDLLPLLSIRRT